MEPQVAIPHAVDQVVDLSEVAGTHVDVVFMGTCTNGRYEDMRRGRRYPARAAVSARVRFLVTPASSRELDPRRCRWHPATLIEAGATLTTPGCGPCMGRHQGTLGDEMCAFRPATAISKAAWARRPRKIYLASPAVAAATALTGVITDPEIQ